MKIWIALYHYLSWRLPPPSPCRYDDLLPRSKNLESFLEQAMKEAVDDATLRKIKRISYSANAATEVINFTLLIATFTCSNIVKCLVNMQWGVWFLKLFVNDDKWIMTVTVEGSRRADYNMLLSEEINSWESISNKWKLNSSSSVLFISWLYALYFAVVSCFILLHYSSRKYFLWQQ